MKRTILFLILALMLCAALVVGVNATDSTEYTWDSANNIFDFRGYSSTFVDENGTAHITAGYIVNADAEDMFKDMFGEGSNFKYGVFGALVKRDEKGTLLSPLAVENGRVVANYESNIPVEFCDFNTSFMDKTGTGVDRGQINAILKNIIHDEKDYRKEEVCLGIYVTDGEFVKYITSKGLSETPEVIRFADFAQGLVSKDATINVNSGEKVTLGDLFALSDNVTLDELDEAVIITTTVNGQTNTLEISKNDFASYELELLDVGEWTIEVKGNNRYLLPATAKVTVNPCDKLEVKFPNTDKYLYRVGNGNAISIGSLFGAIEGFTIADFGIAIDSDNVTYTYTPNSSDWTKGTIKFEGTGVVTVTASCKGGNPISLKLEVVDAVNATSAASATSSNVVLLNNFGFSSLEVSGGYTLYGNGFTMTCSTDSAALDMGYSFVTLDNGTLDNVQIVCPNFDYAVLYKSNMTESGNRSETTDRTRYYNVKSGVMVSGNSKILNSRISGARAAVNVTGGNCLIDNSRIELGAVASILVGSANSLTLRDVTLVQKPTASTYDPTKVLMGFSVLLICDANGDAAPITLEGKLIQNAWIDESDNKYVPSAGQSIISTVLSNTEYLHDIDGDGTNESLNLGFAYMPESLTSKVNKTTITDNRTNKNDIPYDYAEISISLIKTYVYSYINNKGTADSFKTESEYVSNKQCDSITVTYSDTADGLENGKSFGTNGWTYELNVDLDKLSGYKLDFSKLSMSINGVTVNDYKVNGSAKPTSPVAVTVGGVTYTLTATVSGKEYTATFKVTGTETSKESPSLVATNYAEGLCVASSYGGTWHGAAPALEGIQIKYWSVAEKQYKTINLADYTPTTKGQQNGTNATWTYSPENGDFSLTLTGGQVHSGNNVYAMPVVCDGKLYFVASKSNGLVNSGNSARTIPVSYTFKDNNNGDVLTFSHTWSVAENKNNQYKYSDFCKGTLTKLKSCVTPDTLVTLADGTQKEIQYVTYDDMFLVYDFVNGAYICAPASIIMNHGYDEYTVTTLNFDDGTVVNTINGHGFYCTDSKEFIILSSSNVQSYVGSHFIKADGRVVTLDSYTITKEYTESWSVLTAEHYNCVLEGMLTLTPAEVDGSPLYLMPYEIGDDMKYDQEKMQADIEKYGLYTYDDFKGLVTYEQFVAFGLENFKVSVGKGYITWDEILFLLSIHVG